VICCVRERTETLCVDLRDILREVKLDLRETENHCLGPVLREV
jgi:hypothetical protein